MHSRNHIITDLIRLRPRGPEGTQHTYTEKGGVLFSNVPRFGYTEEEIIGLHIKNYNDAADALRDVPVRTGRSRDRGRILKEAPILWDRIKECIKDIMAKGRPGVYDVVLVGTRSWDRELLMKTYAHSLREAEELSQMMLGAYLPEGHTLSVVFHSLDNMQECSSENTQTLQRLSKRLSEARAETEARAAREAARGVLLEAVQMFACQQLAIETSALMDAQKVA